MLKAIIFGINGQDGFYLSQLLFEKKIEVIGISRSNTNWIIGDVSDFNFVKCLIIKNQPHYIFHLAANSTTRHDVLFENHESISTGTLNILECCFKFSPNTKIFLSGSGLQFENTGKPIKECDSFSASSAYAIARIQSVFAARYFRSLGLKIYVGYFFNHDSPLRSERHVNQKIIKALKRISEGNNETLNLLNITVKKEFGFAGDIVEGIWHLVENNNIFEAVIGTGLDYSIEDWLDICGRHYNLDWKKFTHLQKDSKKEYERLVSNPETMNSLNWFPKISVQKLAEIMINTELK